MSYHKIRLILILGVAKILVKKLRHLNDEILVIPLLRALGSTPQKKIAIEWNNVDIALFSKAQRNDESLSVVVEAKRKGNSCLTAQSQAQAYAEGKINCHRLIVTDGLRYGVYVKENECFRINAYMNLTELRNSYPIYNCTGVLDALNLMAPEWTL